jgi:hypothetical protein
METKYIVFEAGVVGGAPAEKVAERATESEALRLVQEMPNPDNYYIEKHLSMGKTIGWKPSPFYGAGRGFKFLYHHLFHIA